MVKVEAINILRKAGYHKEADYLENWKDTNGNDWGWNGHVAAYFPEEAIKLLGDIHKHE